MPDYFTGPNPEPEVSNIMCQTCKYWHVDPAKNRCKCIDYSKVRFFRPYFSCEICRPRHTICGAYEPNRATSPAIAYEWAILGGFKPWHSLFIKQWWNGKAPITQTLIRAVPRPNREFGDDRYLVPYEDFINCKIMRPDGIHYLDYWHIERAYNTALKYVWIRDGPGILRLDEIRGKEKSAHEV